MNQENNPDQSKDETKTITLNEENASQIFETTAEADEDDIEIIDLTEDDDSEE